MRADRSLAARVPGACFLDLFAGSGAYGLEALSRGATSGSFVEKNAKAAQCLRQNLAAVCKSLRRTEGGVLVSQSDALDWALPSGAPVPDLVFIDPPYPIIPEIAPKLFQLLSNLLIEKTDPVIVFEMPGEQELVPAVSEPLKRVFNGTPR